MPAIMMSGRELRRVPLDFAAPLNETWQGYINPYHFPNCPSCDGTGYSPEAYAIAFTFYPHQIRTGDYWDPEARALADKLAWHDKIGQQEVEALVEENRLRELRNGEWVKVQRYAPDVNAANDPKRGGGLLSGHDAINKWILVDNRCRLLGIPRYCDDCLGSGAVAGQDELKAAEEWEGTDPPEGEGYQLWETVSEGSPITPVFATLDELLDHLPTTNHGTAGARWSREEWERILTGDAIGADMRTGEVV